MPRGNPMGTRPVPNPDVVLACRRQVRRKGQVIGTLYAQWQGGPYIDLTFSREIYATAWIKPNPTEVINVWDYEKSAPEVPFEQRYLAIVVEDWMKDQDEEWPEWFEGYLENARY